jgi:hypothetical protein
MGTVKGLVVAFCLIPGACLMGKHLVKSGMKDCFSFLQKSG